MRIDVIVVITGLSQTQLDSRERLIDQYARPGIDIRVRVAEGSPLSVESEAEMELAAPGILKAVVQSASSGADAIVIWGGHDPSLRAARELVKVPVVAPGMASILLISSLVNQFGLLVQMPNVLEIARRQIRDIGLSRRCSSIRSVDIPVLELARDDAFPAILRAAQRAIDEDGVDGICFGCMAMTRHVSPLREVLADSHPGTVVVDPGYAAIKWTEMLLDMGLNHSKRSYPPPPKPMLQQPPRRYQ